MRAEVILQRKFQNYGVIRYVVVPAYKNEDIFIFCLLLNRVLLSICYLIVCSEGLVTCVQYLFHCATFSL